LGEVMERGRKKLTLSEVVHRVADYARDAMMICEAESAVGGTPTVVYVNAAFTAMTGYTEQDILGRTPRILQGPGSSGATRQSIRDALRAWKPVTAEMLNYRKDGTPFWVELSITPVADEGGWYRYWISVQRDLTERHRHEQERLMRDQIMQALSDAVVLVDALQPDLPIVYVNDVFTRMTGYSSAEVLGRNCRFLQGPDSDPGAIGMMRQALADQRPLTLELVNYRRDGSRFWNLLTLSPMLDQAGRALQFMGLLRDVTEVKEREQQMVISQRVKAVGELAGGIAHDFNNLLTSILGSAQLLQDSLDDKELAQARAKTIIAAAQHGASQVKRLMGLSRTPMLARGAVDLRAVVDQLLQLLMRILPESIDVRVDIPDVARWVDAETVQMESALLNLVINARDAMPHGGTIRLRSRAWSEGGQPWVRLSVEDEGLGMDDMTQQRLFDPFFTTKPAGQGSGLGLAMVHSFVTQLGGRVEVRSSPGKGSCLDLILHAAEPSAAPAPAVAPTEEAGPAAHSGCVVLLVEDDPVVRLTAKAMLERLGHHAVDCASGQEALEVLKSPQALDLLLTDMVMPGGLNGRQLALQTRNLRPGLPILLASGWADASMDDDAPGAVPKLPFLSKPYSMDELSQAVEAALAMKP
jgi:two-component system, cell cycle sensor histidine kinase and response regulator CckA